MDFDINEFVFEHVLVLDLPKEPADPVRTRDLMPHEAEIRDRDALLIRTGFSRFRSSDPSLYVNQTPGFSIEAAEFLTDFRTLKCVGVDWISIENLARGRKDGYPVHRVFLSRVNPMLLLEDANLAALGHRPVRSLLLVPLRIEGLEASPVTALAEV
jgi:kynurenine formamidase